MSFCCAFVLLVGLARARCPSKFAYVRRAFYSNRRAPGDMRAKKASSVLASFRRGDTYDHIRRARSARMIYFLSESRTRAEPQDEYFLTRYLGSRRIDEYLERSKLGTKGYELLSSGRVKSVLIDGKRLV